MFWLGLTIGSFIGLSLMAIIKQGRIADQQGLIDASRRALGEAEMRLTERNKFIKKQSADIKVLKNKITDLENNVEFLFNNLSAQKKKLVTNRK